jgi:undecaprenyl-diphosphatase
VSAFEAFVLGIVQGLTEFLPVSSSGHLVIFGALLGVEDESSLFFEVALHVATLAAIVIFYRRKIAALIVGALKGDSEAIAYGAKLGLATLPAIGLALVARDEIESAFAAPTLVALCLFATGAILWTTRRTLPKALGATPSWLAALLIGCAQALAILPGISRSGTTVAAALALGVAPLAAAEFSFLLGIIAISGAAVLMIPELGSVSADAWQAIAIGSSAALISGLAALWLFIWLLSRRAFYAFSYYLWAAGGLFLVWLYL